MHSAITRWLPAFNKIAMAAFFAGLGVLTFISGAGVMHFRQPPSDQLRKAFVAAKAWWEQPEAEAAHFPSPLLATPGVSVYKPEKAHRGFTLATTSHKAEAALLDMDGQVVHRWSMATALPWHSDRPTRAPAPGGPFHWERCRVFPDGDLLALCCTSTPHGYGLAKFDKDSQLLWGYSGHVHHSFDVADDGRIFLLTDRHELDFPGDDPAAPRHIAEFLVVLSPEGSEIDSIPIMEAFQNSPFNFYLEEFVPPHPTLKARPQTELRDLLHVNSVDVLGRDMARHFPLFKPGQVLLSLRTPSVLAVLDPQSRAIVWAARGVWEAQHDAQFLDNGHILLFDNLGDPRRSRVIEYDPKTQAVAWWWGGAEGTRWTSVIRGGSQRLGNGNTLIVDSVGCAIYEVTSAKEIVWRWNCPLASSGVSAVLNVTSGRRFEPRELPFLNTQEE